MIEIRNAKLAHRQRPVSKRWIIKDIIPYFEASCRGCSRSLARPKLMNQDWLFIEYSVLRTLKADGCNHTSLTPFYKHQGRYERYENRPLLPFGLCDAVIKSLMIAGGSYLRCTKPCKPSSRYCDEHIKQSHPFASMGVDMSWHLMTWRSRGDWCWNPEYHYLKNTYRLR